MQVSQVGPWERTDLAIQQHAMFYMGGTLERPATSASDQTAGLVSPESPPASLPASRLPHPTPQLFSSHVTGQVFCPETEQPITGGAAEQLLALDGKAPNG